MHFTDFLPLISAVFVFFIGVMIYWKNPKSRINTTFLLHALVITAWLFGTFMMFINREDREAAIFWDRFIYAVVSFIPVFMYHFGLAYRNKKPDFLLRLGYVLSPIFLVLSQTPYFVADLFQYQWGVHTKAQLFHHIFLIYFVGYVLIWFVQFFKYYRTVQSPFYKVQTRYILLGFLFLFGIGPVAYLPAYGIGIYPFAYVSGVLFTAILAYAIIVHRLMDIKFVLRKYSVYLLSLGAIMLLATPVLMLFDRFLPEARFWANLLTMALAVSVFPSVKDFSYRIANKYFFSSLYDGQKVIAELSESLRSTLDIDLIYRDIDRSLESAFHSKAFGILSYKEEEKVFMSEYNRDFQIGKKSEFEENSLLHNKFIKQNKPIVVDELDRHFRNKATSAAIDEYKGYGVEVLAPMTIKKRVVGLLALGAKESGEMYNEEDLQVLNIVGAQAAIAIENALLYEEAKRFNVRLQEEVKKATADLRAANERLKKLDEAKSEFISIASHQLRTPLTVIKGYISMILEKAFGELTAGEEESLTKVYESNERLIKLVENLLNISRIESGRLQFNWETMQLEDLVGSVFEELKTTDKAKKLRFSFKKPKKALPAVKIDEEKVRQVVMNLTDNAIKYTNKGSVTVDLSLEKDKKHIRFCVQDSGMGIKPDDLDNLFKKFSRGSGTALVHTEGTGLGLYVAKQMIEAHKGKIWAESDGEGKGSRFCFILPAV